LSKARGVEEGMNCLMRCTNSRRFRNSRFTSRPNHREDIPGQLKRFEHSGPEIPARQPDVLLWTSMVCRMGGSEKPQIVAVFPARGLRAMAGQHLECGAFPWRRLSEKERGKKPTICPARKLQRLRESTGAARRSVWVRPLS